MKANKVNNYIFYYIYIAVYIYIVSVRVMSNDGIDGNTAVGNNTCRNP